jgi:hypothetical protein
MDAILNGERNPEKLAALRDRRIKADEKTIVKALKGDYHSEHIFTLKQSLQSYRNYQEMIRDCDVETQKYLQKFESRIDLGEKPMELASRRKPRRNEPVFDLRTHLYRILGTDLCEIDGISLLTSHVFLTEVGPDISKFPTVKHFCSWLGISPNNKISDGKILSSKTRPGSNRAAQALRLAARALWNSQSFLGHYFRRMRARHGAPKATTATAHKLARIIYHLVKTGKQFDESVFSEQEERHQKRLEQNLKKQAKYLGYQLVPLEST